MNKYNAIAPDLNDLINHAEKQVEYFRKNNTKQKLEGKISAFTADRRLACAESILTLLKRFKRDPQIDLFEELKRM